MTQKAHSHIGASSMYRWSACPGSVKLSDGMPNITSAYTAEGTAAHGIAERLLRDRMAAYPATMQVEGHEIEVTEEMLDAVRVYLEECTNGPKTAARHIEHRFDLSHVYPGLFGTSDYVRYDHAAKLLTVIDYKHGAGIPVEVKDNPQLYYYALGALLTLKYPALEVEMVIVQPRCHHPDGPVRRHRISVIDMLDFQVDLIQYAKATEDPNAPITPGLHCRFCLAAAVCPALASKAQSAAALAFAPDTKYDPAKLAEALSLADTVEGWAKSVREFAYAQAEAGNAIPGWKLVAKQARRAWRDIGAAEQALKLVGLGETQMYAMPELRSPAQIETVLKDLKMKPVDRLSVISPLVEKKSSGNVLAPEGDGRPAVSKQSAADAFNL